MPSKKSSRPPQKAVTGDQIVPANFARGKGSLVWIVSLRLHYLSGSSMLSFGFERKNNQTQKTIDNNPFSLREQ
jgi:hypothetical protein